MPAQHSRSTSVLTPLSAAALGRWDYLASYPLDSLQGKGLLQAAVRGDRPAVLRQLLEMGLDPDERMQIGNHEDQTFSAGGPLLEAVNTGRIDMARVLLAHGADPNASVFTAGSATAASVASPRNAANLLGSAPRTPKAMSAAIPTIPSPDT